MTVAEPNANQLDHDAMRQQTTFDPRRRTATALMWAHGLSALLLAAAAVPSPGQEVSEGQPEATKPTQDSTADQAGGDASGLLERSLERATSVWERSADTADTWWQRSRDATLEVWDEAQQSLRPTDPSTPAQVWKDLAPKLDETLALTEERPQLPERAWLGRDQGDADTEINALLDAAVGILSRSPVQRYRARITELRTEIAEARAEIDRFRRERIAAPRESLITATVADYEERIAEREAEIRADLAELERVKAEFVADLRGMGLELSGEQVDLLLATVVGDNIIDLGILFDNVKAITRQLESLVEESGEDLESARRYYGMYVVLLRALEHMHTHVLQAIDTDYLPRIDAIAERAAALSEETRALIETQPDRAELLRNNLQAQQLTIEAAGVYRDYLEQQRAQVEQAQAALEADIDTAWNTYQTVQVSGELVDLVQSSRSLLDNLLNREVPPLRPFQNLAMQRELEKLTRQLRRAED
jgi:hypothetical protein